MGWIRCSSLPLIKTGTLACGIRGRANFCWIKDFISLGLKNAVDLHGLSTLTQEISHGSLTPISFSFSASSSTCKVSNTET